MQKTKKCDSSSIARKAKINFPQSYLAAPGKAHECRFHRSVPDLPVLRRCAGFSRAPVSHECRFHRSVAVSPKRVCRFDDGVPVSHKSRFLMSADYKALHQEAETQTQKNAIAPPLQARQTSTSPELLGSSREGSRVPVSPKCAGFTNKGMPVSRRSARFSRAPVSHECRFHRSVPVSPKKVCRFHDGVPVSHESWFQMSAGFNAVHQEPKNAKTKKCDSCAIARKTNVNFPRATWQLPGRLTSAGFTEVCRLHIASSSSLKYSIARYEAVFQI